MQAGDEGVAQQGGGDCRDEKGPEPVAVERPEQDRREREREREARAPWMERHRNGGVEGEEDRRRDVREPARQNEPEKRDEEHEERRVESPFVERPLVRLEERIRKRRRRRPHAVGHRQRGGREGQKRDSHESGASAEARENRPPAPRAESPGGERVEARREARHRVAEERFGHGPQAEQIEQQEDPGADHEHDEAARARVLAGDSSCDLADRRERDQRDSDRKVEAALVEQDPEERDDDQEQEERRHEPVDLKDDAFGVVSLGRLGVGKLTGRLEAHVPALLQDEPFRGLAVRALERADPGQHISSGELVFRPGSLLARRERDLDAIEECPTESLRLRVGRFEHRAGRIPFQRLERAVREEGDARGPGARPRNVEAAGHRPGHRAARCLEPGGGLAAETAIGALEHLRGARPAVEPDRGTRELRAGGRGDYPRLLDRPRRAGIRRAPFGKDVGRREESGREEKDARAQRGARQARRDGRAQDREPRGVRTSPFVISSMRSIARFAGRRTAS